MIFTSTSWSVAIIICVFIISLFGLLGRYFVRQTNTYIIDAKNFAKHPHKYKLYFVMFAAFVPSIEILLDVFQVREHSLLIPNTLMGILGLAVIYFSQFIDYLRNRLHLILIIFYIIFTLLATYKVSLNPNLPINLAELITLSIFSYFIFHKIQHFLLYIAALFVLLLIIHLQGKMDIKMLTIYYSIFIMSGSLNYARGIIDKTLQESLFHAYDIVNKGNIGLLGINEEGIVIFISDNIHTLLGCEKASIIGKNWHSNILHIGKIKLEKLEGNESKKSYTQKLTQENGDFKFIEWQISSSSKDGLFIHIGHDVTEQKQAEIAIKQLNILHQNLLDNVPGYVVCKDYDGHFLFANKALAELLGKMPEEVIGLTDADYGASPAEIDFYQETDRLTIDSGKPMFISEQTILRKDGTRGIFQTNKIPINFLGTEKGAVLVVDIEISELKKTEAALLKSQEKLLYKSQILNAIAKTTEKLLVSKDINETLSESFDLIGKATNVDRVYYFEKNFETHYLSQKVEWVKGNIVPQIDNPLLQEIVLESFPELNEHLLKNDTYIMKVSDIKDIAFKQMLIEQDILSMLNIPIFIKNTFYGFIGFDDCSQNREWTIDEVSILQSLATNIANAIERVNNEAIIAESENNFRQINETIDDVFWLYDIQHNKIDYISPSCLKVLGVNQEGFYKKNDYWILYVLEEDKPMISKAHQQIQIDGYYEVEYRININNEVRWIFEKSFAIQNKDGKVVKNSGICSDITEKKRTQDQLKKLSLVAEKTTNGVLIADTQGRVTWANLGALEMFEISLSNLLGKRPGRLFDTVQPKDDSVATNFTKEIEILSYKKNKKWIEVTNTAIFDENGTFIQQIEIVTDITYRKQTEEKLRKSQQDLLYKGEILSAIAKTTEKLLVSKNVEKTLSETFPFIGKSLKVDRVYYFENDVYTERISAKSEWLNEGISTKIDNPQLQNMRIAQFGSAASHLLANKPFQRMTRDVTDVAIKERLAEQCVKSVLLFPIFIKDVFYGILGFDDCQIERVWSADEITILHSLVTNIANALERINHELVIEESENIFRQINETIESVFWLQDVIHNKILYISPSCQSVLGASQSDFYAGKPYVDIYVVPEDREKNKLTPKYLLEHDVYELEYQISIEEKIKWIQEKAFAIRNEKGKLIRISGICYDVTEKIEKQHELEHLLAVTNKQNERLTNFAHIISHNIRSHSSNLTSLMEFVNQTEDEMEREMYLTMIQRSIDKLAETIENLNEIITIQNNLNIPKTTLSLNREISTTINALGSLIQNADATILHDIDDALTIQAIPAYLESILLNLLTNAIKYRSNERSLVVTFSTHKKDDYWVLSIQDNGVGIDLERHGHKLFGMYKTFHKNKDARGIGLFITKNQIEAMGGKIEVESQVGVGTTFNIYFHEKD